MRKPTLYADLLNNRPKLTHEGQIGPLTWLSYNWFQFISGYFISGFYCNITLRWRVLTACLPDPIVRKIGLIEWEREKTVPSSSFLPVSLSLIDSVVNRARRIVSWAGNPAAAAATSKSWSYHSELHISLQVRLMQAVRGSHGCGIHAT